MPGVRPGAEPGAPPAAPDLYADPAPEAAAGPSPRAADGAMPHPPEGEERQRAPEGTGAPDTPAAAAPGPAAPAPLGVPRTPTGVAEVDARLDRLADADHLGTGEHLEVYEDVHQGLRDTLTALDRRPGPPAPAPHGPV